MRGTAACGITVSRSDSLRSAVSRKNTGTADLFRDSNTTYSQLGKSDHPSMDLKQPKLLKPILRKNQYLLTVFFSVRYRAVKVTKASWFYRKSLALERITSIKNTEKRLSEVCHTRYNLLNCSGH